MLKCFCKRLMKDEKVFSNMNQLLTFAMKGRVLSRPDFQFSSLILCRYLTPSHPHLVLRLKCRQTLTEKVL